MRFPWPFRRAERNDAAPLALPSPAALASRAARYDAWINEASGVGVPGRDPRLAASFYADVIPEQVATDIVRGDHVAAKVVEKPVDQMFRPGFEVKIVEQDDARTVSGVRAGTDERPAVRLAKDVSAEWKRLRVMKALRKAMKWERKDGGAAILLGINDGSPSMASPLQLGAQRLQFKWLRVLRASDLQPVAYYEDPEGEKFDEPMIWRINNASRNGRRMVQGNPLVHESRLIIFEGVKVTDDPLIGQMPGFGDSVLNRFFRVLRRYGSALDNAEVLLGRFGEPVWKMEGLDDILAKDKDGSFKAFIAAKAYVRSVLRVNLVDAKDDVSNQAVPVTGLPELIGAFQSELQAAADMPMTEIFGDAPGGLGNNGEGSKRDWYDVLDARREEQAIPPLEYITRALFYHLGGKEPAEWEVKGKPFWQLSAKELADIAAAEAQTDNTYVQMQAVTSDDVARRPSVTERYAIDHDARDAQATVVDVPDDIRGGEVVDPAAPQAPEGEAPAPLLTGQQAGFLLDVVGKVSRRELPRDVGAGVLAYALQITDPAALAMMLPEPPPAAPSADPPPPQRADAQLREESGKFGGSDGAITKEEAARRSAASAATAKAALASKATAAAPKASEEQIHAYARGQAAKARKQREAGDHDGAKKTLEEAGKHAEALRKGTLSLEDLTADAPKPAAPATAKPASSDAPPPAAAQLGPKATARLAEHVKSATPPVHPEFKDVGERIRWMESPDGKEHEVLERAYYETLANERGKHGPPPDDPEDDKANQAYDESRAGKVWAARQKVLEVHADDLEEAINEGPAELRHEALLEDAINAKDEHSSAKSSLRAAHGDAARGEKKLAKMAERRRKLDEKLEAAKAEGKAAKIKRAKELIDAHESEVEDIKDEINEAKTEIQQSEEAVEATAANLRDVQNSIESNKGMVKQERQEARARHRAASDASYAAEEARDEEAMAKAEAKMGRILAGEAPDSDGGEDEDDDGDDDIEGADDSESPDESIDASEDDDEDDDADDDDEDEDDDADEEDDE